MPYTLNGGLYYNCTVNAAVNSDFGCYHSNGQWVKCQQPDGMFSSPPTRGAKYCNQSVCMFVCLFVCLSVRWVDYKCGSEKCDMGKIVRVENAGVEKATV